MAELGAITTVQPFSLYEKKIRYWHETQKKLDCRVTKGCQIPHSKNYVLFDILWTRNPIPMIILGILLLIVILFRYEIVKGA